MFLNFGTNITNIFNGPVRCGGAPLAILVCGAVAAVVATAMVPFLIAMTATLIAAGYFMLCASVFVLSCGAAIGGPIVACKMAANAGAARDAQLLLSERVAFGTAERLRRQRAGLPAGTVYVASSRAGEIEAQPVAR